MSLIDYAKKFVALLRSPRGRNFFVFSIFLIIAAFLWCVLALNDEVQADVRMPVRITNVPDSVTIVSAVPSTVSVGVRARGTQLLKYSWGKAPAFDIDFRVFRDGNYLRLSSADMKSITRQTLNGASIVVVSPDSLSIAFTSRPPVVLPVKIDCSASAAPQAIISGKPRVKPDSVRVYAAGGRRIGDREVATEPIHLTDLKETTTIRARLIAPSGTRVIPDSVDVTVNVEALIYKTRMVSVETVNVPKDYRLVTFPSQVEVGYLIPVSDYVDVNPKIRVVADYDHLSPNGKVRLKIAEASDNLLNVSLAADSVEYILEKYSSK